jgi:OTU domain-containing protein 6
LKIPIFIYQAGSPVLKLGEQYVGVRPEVRLSYHRHAYGLGEHYNSLLEEGE